MKKRVENKRAQTTIFILLAVVIVVVVLAVFLSSKTSSKTELQSIFSRLEIKTEAAQVESAFRNCLDTTARDALTTIGIQGGYYNPPEKFFDLSWAFIPYYYYEGSYLIPTQQTIEKELAVFVDDNLHSCSEQLAYDDFTIDSSHARTLVKIEKAKVSFTIDATFTVRKGESSSEYRMKEYPVEIESALSDILELASYITESHKEDSTMICISCLTEMASERNLYVDILDFTTKTDTLVVISENYTSTEPYIFEFLNKYPQA